MIESSLRLALGCVTHPGQARPQNEDAFAVSRDHRVFLLSDGMGGHNAGEAAAKYVVESLPPALNERAAGIPASQSKKMVLAIPDAIVDISQEIRKEGESKRELRGMGATLVMGYLRGSHLYIANMGDSRAYLYRDHKLKQLTHDHSIVGILVEGGEITTEEARTHPARGTVSRYMGMEGVVYPDVTSMTLRDSDQLLLCSDGLTGMVPDEEIATVLARALDPQQKCQFLVDAANDAGGRDNITVLIAHFDA